MKKILELLADQINKSGGLSGKQVEIVTADDGGDPRTAVLAETDSGPSRQRLKRDLSHPWNYTATTADLSAEWHNRREAPMT